MKFREAKTKEGVPLRTVTPTISHGYTNHPSLSNLNQKYQILQNRFVYFGGPNLSDQERLLNGLGRIYTAFEGLCALPVEDLENHVTKHFMGRGIPLLRSFEDKGYLQRDEVIELGLAKISDPINVAVDLPTEGFLKAMKLHPYVETEQS